MKFHTSTAEMRLISHTCSQFKIHCNKFSWKIVPSKRLSLVLFTRSSFLEYLEFPQHRKRKILRLTMNIIWNIYSTFYTLLLLNRTKWKRTWYLFDTSFQNKGFSPNIKKKKKKNLEHQFPETSIHEQFPLHFQCVFHICETENL